MLTDWCYVRDNRGINTSLNTAQLSLFKQNVANHTVHQILFQCLMYQNRTTFHVASPDIQLTETSLWTFHDPILTVKCPCLDTLATSPFPLHKTLLWEWWSVIANTHIYLQFQMQLKWEKKEMLIYCVHFLFFIIYIQSRDFPTPRISKYSSTNNLFKGPTCMLLFLYL